MESIYMFIERHFVMWECENKWDSTRDTGRKLHMASLLTQHLVEKSLQRISSERSKRALYKTLHGVYFHKGK